MIRPSTSRSPATRAPGVPEIGSDFEVVEDRYLGPHTSTQLPWEDAAGIIYVESGRQALAAAGAELRSLGHTKLHVPAYLCDSMITPFDTTGWTLSPLPVDNDLAINPTDLLARVTDGVFLHTPYFGRQDSAGMLAALGTLRTRGVVVMVDETHRLFSGRSQVADIRVASLRKLLPLYDGGYVAGLSGRFQTRLGASSPHSEIAELRQLAGIAKSNAIASGNSSDVHLALYARAEHATDNRARPAPMSSKSLSLMHRLDMNLIRMTRRTNSTVLNQALGHGERFRIINPPTANLLPSHLVLETDDVTGLRRYLIDRRIYCPIHWPPSELLPRTEEWPSRYLSLPIDQRYGETDMLRMAAEVITFFRRN